MNTQMSYASTGFDAKPHDENEDSKKSEERKREQKQWEPYWSCEGHIYHRIGTVKPAHDGKRPEYAKT